MIVHNDCGGTILFETRQQAIERLLAAAQAVPAAPREIRQLYCAACDQHWARKADLWREAHSEPDPQ